MENIDPKTLPEFISEHFSSFIFYLIQQIL